MTEFYLSRNLRILVWQRAQGFCEYCGIHEDDSFHSHEPDHIISLKHGGKTNFENLALSCFFCNRRKGTDIASFDPITGELFPFFNPSGQHWNDHFKIKAPYILPQSPEGRVTATIFRFNHPKRLLERTILFAENKYPFNIKLE